MIFPWRVAAAFVLLTLPLSAAQADPLSYSITDLGTLPGTTQSIATGINAQGQVVGVSYTTSDGTWNPTGVLYPLAASTGLSYDAGAKSFLYSNGQLTQINPAGGLVNAINNAGQVVGGNFSSINNWGQSVGSDGAGVTYKDQYTAGVPSQLVTGNVSTPIPLLPLSINDAGQVVGNIEAQTPGAGYIEHAAVYQNGQLTDLAQQLGLQGASSATAINNSGAMIIENLLLGGGTQTHYLYYNPASHSLTDLTSLPGGLNFYALALNNQGQIVGNGLLFSNGEFTSLQSLLPQSSGWSNLVGTAINDAGQIVGEGLINGKEEAFLLTPPQATPEPMSLAVFAVSFALLAIHARRARRCRSLVK